MNDESSNHGLCWRRWVAFPVFAVLFLPMAPHAVETRVLQAQEQKKDASEGARPGKKPAKTDWPVVVDVNPKPGATGVDPALKEITVTFDRDMDTKGMSWTGDPPSFPPSDKGARPRWIDVRTCVLPVKLEQGAFYRLGINSTDKQNFRSADQVAFPPSVLVFCTAGATKAVEERMRVPTVVKLEPENGAADVDPATPSLRVTFDMPMGNGMSWTKGGKAPKSPEGKKPTWSADGTTCTLPVALEPGRDYAVGLNSLKFNNFQSKWGMPLDPVLYKFRTRAK